MHAYIDSVHDRNSRRGPKATGEPARVDPDEVKGRREEAWWYWVKQKIRRTVNAVGPDGAGKLKISGRVVITKPITGDPLVDGDNGHPNGVETFIPD